MSEIMDGFGRFDDLYRKAYWAKTSLDCTANVFDKESALDDCVEYLRERQKNRTAGDIAYAEVIRKNPLDMSSNYSKNFNQLSMQPIIDEFLYESASFNKKNYPKTGRIRSTLIKNNRFRLYEVLPKMTSFTKFAMKYLK